MILESFEWRYYQEDICLLLGDQRNQKKRVSTEEIYTFFRELRRRWVVERSFAWLNRKSRRLLMRWERLLELWEAFAVLGLFFISLEIFLE